ncbi:MAG TPA: hypothetical protein DCX32_04490 [Candidatus Moranbacteria bacterium]|nr:hypothetical protein [Candidatus Moranbacteria bacterium]
MKKHEIGNRLEAILALARDCIEETRRPLWEMNFKEFPFDLESERDWLANMETLNRLLSKFQLACKKLEESEFSGQERKDICEKVRDLTRKFPDNIGNKFKELLSGAIFRPKIGEWVRVSRGFYHAISGKIISVDPGAKKFTAEFLVDGTVRDSPYQTDHHLETKTLPFSAIEQFIVDSLDEYEDMLVKYREGYISSI